MNFGPQFILLYLRHYNYYNRELRSVGVKVHPSSSGYYVFPDFGVCKPGLNALGVRTAEQFCARMLEEAGVAVSTSSVCVGGGRHSWAN